MEALPDRGWSLYVEFLTHADSMCIFIQNQNFERYTEGMLGTLAEGGAFARGQLEALGASAAAVGKDAQAILATTQVGGPGGGRGDSGGYLLAALKLPCQGAELGADHPASA